MLTEEQARKKWCPLVHDERWKNKTDMPAEMSCIASKCMAWRWTDLTISLSYGTEFDNDARYYESLPTDWADAHLVAATQDAGGCWTYVVARCLGDQDEDASWCVGYCGAFGRPE